MEKLLVTQALDERDLLKKRIADAIEKSNFVATKKPNSNKISGSNVSVTDFESEAKSALQKVTDLISRYERLDSAILLSNATTDVDVAGTKMTRAAAINLRKSILSSYEVSETDFRGILINKLEHDIKSAKAIILRTQQMADKQREVMTSNISSSDKKDLSDDSMQSIDTYCNNLVDILVSPIDAEKKLDELVEKRDALIANLESAIKISNATTYVEF